jgi:hypothetical protein
MDGLPQHSVPEESFEAMTLNPKTPESDGELQAVFENTHRFPTARKPIDSLRQMDTQTSAETFHDWFTNSKVSIGNHQPDQVKHEPRNERELVLLRNAALNNRRDKTLELYCGGPLRQDNIAHHGWSGLLYDLVTQLVRTILSVLKDRVLLDDLPIFLPRKKEGIGGHRLPCVMSWDGGRSLDESVWKDVCLGRAVSLDKLLSEDMEGALSRGGPLAGGKGSSCGNKSPEVRMRGQGCQDWSR